MTALMVAADLGHLEVAQALVDGGASVKVTDKDGYSALDYAAIANAGDTNRDGDRAVAVGKYLQAKGASVKKDSSGAGASVGSTLGNLLAVISQPDLKELLEKARASAR